MAKQPKYFKKGNNPLLLRQSVFLMSFFWINGAPDKIGDSLRGKNPRCLKHLYEFIGWDEDTYPLDLMLKNFYVTRKLFYRNLDYLKELIVDESGIARIVSENFICLTYYFFKESYKRYKTEGSVLDNYLYFLDLEKYKGRVIELIGKRDLQDFNYFKTIDYA